MLKENEIAIGEIVAAHGIKGDVKLVVLTDFPERFNPGNRVRFKLNENITEFEILRATSHKSNFTLHLNGIDTRSAAENLRGSIAFVYNDELIALPEDENYAFELIGMEVFTSNNEKLGTITDVLQGGANDVYVINDKICIPAIKECILNVDSKNRKITVFTMPGLL